MPRYFPMQKVEKIRSSTSSVTASPVSSLSEASASARSHATRSSAWSAAFAQEMLHGAQGAAEEMRLARADHEFAGAPVHAPGFHAPADEFEQFLDACAGGGGDGRRLDAGRQDLRQAADDTGRGRTC